MELKWQCIDKNDVEFNQDDSTYLLAWEEFNSIKTFSLLGDDTSFSVNLSTGAFYVDGVEIETGDALSGALSLDYFKRNVIVSDYDGNVKDRRVTYYLGYNNAMNIKKLLKIDDSGYEVIDNY